MLKRAILLTLAMAGLALFSFAQEAAPPREGAAPGPEGGRRFDFAQMRERMMNNLRDQVGGTDEEWKAIQPKIEKIMTIQRDMRMGFGGFGGRSRGGEGGEQPQSKLAEAQRDLRAAVEKKDTPAAELTKKLAALREARAKAGDDLKATQKELKAQIKEPRQEAVLVLNGILE